MAKEFIKDFYGKVIGSIETMGNKQVARDFYGRVLGTYDPTTNMTKDFYGRVVSRGNTLTGLIYKGKK